MLGARATATHRGRAQGRRRGSGPAAATAVCSPCEMGIVSTSDEVPASTIDTPARAEVQNGAPLLVEARDDLLARLCLLCDLVGRDELWPVGAAPCQRVGDALLCILQIPLGRARVAQHCALIVEPHALPGTIRLAVALLCPSRLVQRLDVSAQGRDELELLGRERRTRRGLEFRRRRVQRRRGGRPAWCGGLGGRGAAEDTAAVCLVRVASRPT